MATYCPEDLASRELSCPICFEDYDIQDARRAPKLLLCLHTFCYDCARKLWRNDGSLECSLCRMLHEEVRLDDLLDNHVIVQHLRREFELRDLEFAMRIDQELRQQDSISTPATVSEVTQITKSPVVLEIPDTSFDQVDAELGEDQDEEVEVEEDARRKRRMIDKADLSWVAVVMPPVEEGDPVQRPNMFLIFLVKGFPSFMHYSLSNFIEGIMEGFAHHEPHVTQVGDEDDDDDDNNDDDNDGDDNSGFEEPHVIQEDEAVNEQEADDSHEEDNTNTFFSNHNIQFLFEQSVEESDGESHNEEESSNNMFAVDSVQTVLNMDDNEENDADDDEEDEDERWHSASDDINAICWANNDALPMHDVEDMEDDTPDIFDWHIITSESLLDD
ncbi:uncharacterized protein [Panulirus ornatus]|uniref:uncharacterized protein n=1 Tax=Panulirus ornatus TaxID=150431 RepID=UPI003A894BCC